MLLFLFIEKGDFIYRIVKVDIDVGGHVYIDNVVTQVGKIAPYVLIGCHFFPDRLFPASICNKWKIQTTRHSIKVARCCLQERFHLCWISSTQGCTHIEQSVIPAFTCQ